MESVLLMIGAAIAITAYRKYKGISGIGRAERIKRRVFEEIDKLQQDGVNFSQKYSDLMDYQKKAVNNQARAINYKLSPKSTKEYGEAYYNSLRRSWQAVAGTNLPYRESIVRNSNGDPVVIYRNYGSDIQQLRDAIDYCDPDYANSDFDIFWETMAYLARGGKFVWETKGNKRGLREMLFASKGKVPEERKQRISILASEEKGGKTPEQFAHSIWESGNTSLDDKEILDAVLTALLSVTSIGQAQQYCKDQYLKDHTVPDDEPGEDLPF